jgi:hypothetical protein
LFAPTFPWTADSSVDVDGIKEVKMVSCILALSGSTDASLSKTPKKFGELEEVKSHQCAKRIGIVVGG